MTCLGLAWFGKLIIVMEDCLVLLITRALFGEGRHEAIAKTDLNDGKTCLLWQDIWGQDCIPQLAYPELFSFAKNKAISVAEAKSLGNFHDLFHLPLSEEAYNQYLILQQSLDV